jgi:hypothetical protein
MNDATVINPNKRAEYTFLCGVKFLHTLFKLFLIEGLDILFNGPLRVGKLAEIAVFVPF